MFHVIHKLNNNFNFIQHLLTLHLFSILQQQIVPTVNQHIQLLSGYHKFIV